MPLIHAICTHIGCSWDASILPQKAAFGGSVSLLQWLKELNVGSWESDDNLSFMLSTAGEEGRLDAAKWYILYVYIHKYTQTQL